MFPHGHLVLVTFTHQGKLEPSPAGGPAFLASPSSAEASTPSTVGLSNRAEPVPEISSPGSEVSSPGSETSSDVESASSPPPASTTSGDSVSSTVAGAQPSVVVVGAGPAGLFAALELVEVGVKPVIVERGM